jgi:hypothetical protein
LPVTGPGDASSPFLALAEVSLSQPANLLLPDRLAVTTSDNPAEIVFALWPADGPTERTRHPIYRYPASISVVASGNFSDDTQLKLQLVDANGQSWPATQSEANIYLFVIGPRWRSGDYRLQATLHRDDKIVGQASSEAILTVEIWWQRRFDAPEIAVPGKANFANQLQFLGYALPQNQVKAGEAFPLTLYWQALPDKSPQADFIQFNHLLDSSGALRGGYDRRPLEYYSTLLWASGEVVIDGYAVPVDAEAPPGQYYLNVGYYLTVGESAVNLPLVMDGQMSQVTSVTIGPIQVIE